ncbi:MAG: hypothetical protein KF722_02405 [Nitrospira sp.]|nr:hypothetical protein [Nitrospira sp.]
MVKIENSFMDSRIGKKKDLPSIHNTICSTLTSHFFLSQGREWIIGHITDARNSTLTGLMSTIAPELLTRYAHRLPE